MLKGQYSRIIVEHKQIVSSFLQREVGIDIYIPTDIIEPGKVSLLLINDGQQLPELDFDLLLDQLLFSNQLQPLVAVGIYAGEDRLQEYGTASYTDYKGRGSKAGAYQQFVLQELMPVIHLQLGIDAFQRYGFAGFSLGGLSALDTVWNHPAAFSIAGVFSGSLWWRLRALDDGYVETTDRIMHRQVEEAAYKKGLRFYFTTGSLDETADRNNNGIIDSIDDTLALLEILKAKGYDTTYDIKYVNYEDGRHDMATWKKAMPGFLLWAFGRKE